MPVFTKVKTLVLSIFCFILSACITLPGHRQIIDEHNFFLSIEAPSKDIKNKIRFNLEKTALLYLPENMRIELNVTDNIGTHQIKILSNNKSVSYTYSLNGEKFIFGTNEKKWFALQVPKIISKADL